MKSNGILSRYMRPGFKEGGDSLDMQLMVERKDGKLTFKRSDGSIYLKDPPTNNVNTQEQEGGDSFLDKAKKVWEKMTDETGNPLYDLSKQHQEEKEKTAEDWKRKKFKYFFDGGVEQPVQLFERKRDADKDRAGFSQDATNSGFTPINSNQFDEEKIRDGTQMIFNLDEDGIAIQDGSGFLGSQSPEDIPFMFYDSQDDLDYLLDKTTADDVVLGRPFADDTTWDKKINEWYKATKRGTVGGLLTAPEHLAAAYRYLQPIDALGGVGLYDAFFPKNAEQKELVESSEMYRMPGYSKALNWLSMDPDRPPGVVPSTIHPRDSSLYKDTLYEDEMYTENYNKNERRNLYEGKDEAYIINDLQTKYPNATLEAIQDHIDRTIRPDLDMTEKQFDRKIWKGNRENISHSMPAWVANTVAGMAIPMYGPAGLTSKVAEGVSKGNKFSKVVDKAKKGNLGLRLADSSLGMGIPQGAGEYAVRRFQETEDEDSIYPQ
tara:strand:- start:249 stop:1721 length:1473 start_codon:yes stop_codon:yes gene_type:complete